MKFISSSGQFLALVFVFSSFALSQVSAQTTYTSVSDGAWTSGATWSGGSAPSTAADWSSPNKDIEIYHDITRSGSLTLGGGYHRYVDIYDTLTVTGTLTVSENSGSYPETIVTVKSGGAIIAAALTVQQSSYLLIEDGAHVVISGTLNNNWNSTTIENAGYLEVYDFNNNGTFINSGELVVNNDFTNHYDFTAAFGGTTTVGNDLISNGNMTVPSGSTLDVGNDFYLHDGKTADIDGVMSVAGDVTNNGDIDVDATDGAFVVGPDGSYSGNAISGGGDCGDSGGGCCGGGCATLPVELLSFGVEQEVSGTRLTWVTGSEINNEFFTVEKSLDGKTFVHQATIKGFGSTTDKQFYEWMDMTTGSGVTYYRLSQTDFDGTTEVLGMKALNVSSLEGSVSLYPNPVAQGETLHFSGAVPERLIVFNQSGQIVFDQQAVSQKFDLSGDMKPGLYFIKVFSGGHSVTKRLFVK
ncbi:MAG: T9SS type A sorting domain-containing protein [Cyclobacteriaceae bacterium]